MSETKEIVQITVIAGRGQKNELVDAIIENGGRFVTLSYGKGTVQCTALEEAIGLIPEINKVVINFFVNKKKSDRMFALFSERFNFDEPNTGIAFSVRVNEISG